MTLTGEIQHLVSCSASVHILRSLMFVDIGVFLFSSCAMFFLLVVCRETFEGVVADFGGVFPFLLDVVFLLLLVVLQGDVEEVRRCLLAGFNKVDEVDELGCTPVHLAGAMVRDRRWI